MTEGDDPHAARLRAAEERRQGRTGDSGGREAPLGRDGSSAGENTENLAVSALTDQADLDKLIATGRRDVAPEAVMRQITGWDGLTPKEEEDARLSASRQQALAEYEREMDEIRERADELMQRLDEQEREIRQKLADLEAKPILLSNGHQVRKGANGELVDQVTGRTVEGADKLDAERQQNEKDEEKKKLNSELAENSDARDRVRKAAVLASKDDKDLTPQERKQKEAQAEEDLAVAKAIADRRDHFAATPEANISSANTLSALGLGTGQATASVSSPTVARTGQTTPNASVSAAASDLSNTDTLSALGLASQQPVRTASYIGNTEPKDSRAIVLKEQFALNAEGTSAAAASPVAPAPAEMPRAVVVGQAPRQIA